MLVPSVFPERVVKGLTTEVVVASRNSNSVNIIVLILEICLILTWRGATGALSRGENALSSRW